MHKLEKSIELIRARHKAQEELTFEELVDAVEVLYRATQENADERVMEVSKKNVPYLKKKFAQNITQKYERALEQLGELELFNAPKSRSFSGVINFEVFLEESYLVIHLDSTKVMNYTLSVPIINSTLVIEKLEEDDQIYVTDLIDSSKMMDILNQNKIKYSHIIDSGLYNMIDSWDQDNY